MTEPAYELEPLDRVVNLYRRFREDGEPTETSWRWACAVIRAFEEAEAAESFRVQVQADIDRLSVSAASGAPDGNKETM